MVDKPVTKKKFNEGLDVSQKIREGGVLAKMYLGVQGNNKEAAKKALENTIHNKLEAEGNISLLEVKMYDIDKQGKGFFSGVAEVDFVADDFRWLISTVLRYGPSAFEILEPAEVRLNSEMMHSIAADVCDFSHMYSQQIIAMFKDPERRALYEKMING
ncbi:MAG: hypothetical protein V1744_06200 [Candidatus Altiarchaeota archaeon]